ncbi:uncharacterized protein [Nicotiana tomentosiformis]|uniref:uncharacterized protein isoform X2 n=1 Tax=Nicotiana tomentosiformis TaxID=4098 RepID=UPI00051B09BC|nr:uncharacterized protein LOC104113862 isoform X2 [Nicotiana tomentosiformis]
MDIESGSPNSNVTFSTHETILPMPQFTPSPEVNSIIRGPADPLVRGEQTKMLLNLEARKVEILEKFIALEKRGEEILASLYNTSSAILAVGAFSFFQLRTLTCELAFKIFGLCISYFLINLSCSVLSASSKFVVLYQMNDALRKAHDSLVHEAEILKDLEIAKASAEVGCGIEIESEPGVGAVEVEGVLISRSVFFGRSNAILDSDPCTGFNRTRHTVEKISYLFMGFLHLCIAVILTAFLYCGLFSKKNACSRDGAPPPAVHQ